MLISNALVRHLPKQSELYNQCSTLIQRYSIEVNNSSGLTIGSAELGDGVDEAVMEVRRPPKSRLRVS